MIIAVEGMDGAGKTTVCEYVSNTRNYKMVEKPTKYFFFNFNIQTPIFQPKSQKS